MTTLTGKLKQEGTGAPEIILFCQDIISFSTEYLNVGQYKGVCNRAILNSDFPAKWFTANEYGARYSIEIINQTDILIRSFNPLGDSIDDILSGGVEFKIETK